MTGTPRPPRGGLEGYQIRAIGYGVYVWGMTVAVLLFVGRPMGLSAGELLLAMIFGGAFLGLVVAVLAAIVTERVGDRARAIYAPTGASTPYTSTFSYQQAMAMKGDVKGALESFEALIAESPADPAPRLAAAELYAGRGGDPKRAAELYREARALPSAQPVHEMTATNALIDLYRGPLADDARAMSELRRLADRYAGTTAGEMARRLLGEMKAARPHAAP